MPNMLHSRQAPTPDKRYTNLFPGKILLHRSNEQRLEKIVSFSEFSEVVERCWEDVESRLCHVRNGKAYCFGRAFYPCAVPMLSPADHTSSLRIDVRPRGLSIAFSFNVSSGLVGGPRKQSEASLLLSQSRR